MEENKNNDSKFKTVSGSSVYSYNKPLRSGFGKSVLLPFISGIAGCSVVIGTCFGIPSIKNKLIGNITTNISTSYSNSTRFRWIC